ncbi:MAG TPA: SDR family oxidoreductase [Ktedonobacterales bacterium]|nr:SDR family oxidoreductase [Ktedonobacterales bacterium]
MRKLEGKVAVITGSSRGLGLAIARAFTREGAAVVISSSSEPAVREAIVALGGASERVSGIVADVGDLAQVQTLAAHARQTFGRIDIWVNNAGAAGVYGPIAAIPPGHYERIIRTNILGVYHGSLTAIQAFQAQRSGGKLINVLGRGDDGKIPLYQSAYATTKVWVRAFTRALAREYKDSGIGVYALNPGLMDTAFLRKIEAIDGYEKRLAPLSAVIRLWGQPPSVPAEDAVYLASNATDGKTGIERRVIGPRLLLGGLLKEGVRILLRRPAPDTSLTITTIPAYEPSIPEPQPTQQP